MGKNTNSGRNSNQLDNIQSQGEDGQKLPIAESIDHKNITQSNIIVESTLNDTTQLNMEVEDSERPRLTIGAEPAQTIDGDSLRDSSSPSKIRDLQNRHSSAAMLNTPTTADTPVPGGHLSKLQRASHQQETAAIIEEEVDETLDFTHNLRSEQKLADGSIFLGQIKRVGADHSSSKNKGSKNMKVEASGTDGGKIVLHGKGKLILPSGTVIEGEWNNDTIAQGTIAFANGDLYEGEISVNVPHGFGELQRADNGAIIKGMWEQGEINQGTEILKDGQVYTGPFINMKRHGLGECIYPEKQLKYKGLWECGETKGTGEYIELKNGMRQQSGNSENIEWVADLEDQHRATQQHQNIIGETHKNGKGGALHSVGPQTKNNSRDEVIEKSKQIPDEKVFQKAIDQHEEDLDEIRQQFDDDHGVEMVGNVPEYIGEPENGIISTHRQKYMKFCRRRQRQEEADAWAYSKLEKQMREEPIYATKYSHNLESNIMNHFQYECKIELSKDGEALEITNRKLSTAPTYRKEATPDEIMTQRASLLSAEPNSNQLESICESQQDDFVWQGASSTCKLADIQGIIYGGFSSRFWIYRKHMISLDTAELVMDQEIPNYNPRYPGYMNGQPEDLPRKTSFPFFAWQCITLQFETRNLDFVIKDDREMMRFIQFLVQGIRTVDGLRGSANFYIDAATVNEINRLEKKMNKKIQKKRDRIPCQSDEEYEDWLQLKRLSENQRKFIEEQQKKEIYRQTQFKYLMMRIRSKIGYHAFRKHMTVNEHIINTIAKSYKQLTESGEIPVSAPYSPATWQLFEEILEAPMAKTIDGLMELAHDPVLKKRKEQIYRMKELKLLGVRSVEELDQEQQHGINLLFEKNVGAGGGEGLYEDCSSYCGKLEKRQLVDTGRTFRGAGLPKKGDLFIFTDKSKCQDIYLKTLVDKDKHTQINMYEQRSYRVLIKYKYNKKVIENKLNKIKFMLGVGELTDIFYLKAVLLKKSLIKQQFVLDLEHNQEVFIPHTLTCDNYPYSFRYYDPIISITNRLIDSKSKMYHCLKTDFFLKKLQGKDFKKKVLEGIGALPNEKTRPMQFSHAQMKEIALRNIKVTETKHSIALQKSRYLMVESTELGLKKLADLQTYVLEKRLDREPGDRTIKVLEDQQLELRFCQQREVNDKRSKFIIFKQKQFVRHDHLKNQGQKLHTTLLLERHIKENFEELYAARPRGLNYNNEKGAERDLDLVPFSRLTDRQKNMLDRDKVAYFEWLFRHAENLVQERRSRIRVKSIEECYKECGPTKPFEDKNNYIEQKIESTYNYFQIYDDVEHLGFETERDKRKRALDEAASAPRSEWRQRMDELQEIERIRKKLRIVERLIMKQQAKSLSQLDTCVISQMSEKNLKSYAAHKGCKIDLRLSTINNLRDLINEEQILKEKIIKRKSQTMDLNTN